MSQLVIPDAALNSHIAILGKVGSGKTFTAKGLVERLLAAKRQVVIIDPTGAWYGLRTGFEVPIFGGRHGDVDLADTANAGEAVARVIIEQRTSAIVDLSLMSGAGQRRFMRGLAHVLRQKPPGALWVVIDEADEFLPQQLPNDATNLFGDLKWMVRRGRLNGFRVVMITQRPAEIAKAVLTQIETLIAHRLTAPQDRKAVEEWVKGHHAPEEAREVLSTLASLDKGEAWVWAPDLDLLQRATMPPIKTFDSGRTPEPGETDLAPPELARLDLSTIRAAIAAAAPDDLGKKAATAPTWPDQREEVAELKTRLVNLNLEREAMLSGRDQMVQLVTQAVDKLSQIVEVAATPPTVMLASKPETAVAPPPQATRPATAAREPTDGPEPLNPTARAVACLVKAIAPNEIRWDDALLVLGRRPGSGDAGKARKALRDHALVAESGNGLAATEALLADTSFPVGRWPAHHELVDLWAQKLRGPGGDILTDLKTNGPACKEEVGRRIGKAHTSGWFGKGMKDLTRSNLLETRGGKLHLHRLLTE